MNASHVGLIAIEDVWHPGLLVVNGRLASWTDYCSISDFVYDLAFICLHSVSYKLITN